MVDVETNPNGTVVIEHNRGGSIRSTIRIFSSVFFRDIHPSLSTSRIRLVPLFRLARLRLLLVMRRQDFPKVLVAISNAMVPATSGTKPTTSRPGTSATATEQPTKPIYTALAIAGPPHGALGCLRTRASPEFDVLTWAAVPCCTSAVSQQRRTDKMAAMEISVVAPISLTNMGQVLSLNGSTKPFSATLVMFLSGAFLTRTSLY